MKFKILLACSVCLASATSYADSLGTAFTYQGRLATNGVAANGIYDFIFTLYTNSTIGNPINPLPISGVAVTNGAFTTTLDFGSVFNGTANWLGISVRTNNVGSYILLTPRQRLTPAPNALYSIASGTATTASNVVSGSVTGSGIAATTITAANIASGQVVTSLNGLHDALTLEQGNNVTITQNGNTLSIAAVSGPPGWSLSGNIGTMPGQNYVGTADNQPLEFWVNGKRALRLEPGITPNVIGGSAFNVVMSGVKGATIGGGGGLSSSLFNKVTTDYGTVAGGSQNTAGAYATVGGGLTNTASGAFAVVAGGTQNSASDYYATVGGGKGNTAANQATVGGGLGNNASGEQTTVGGGYRNTAGDFSATVGGGDHNTATGQNASIGGGQDNMASNNYAVVGGGYTNIASGYAATVGGGQANVANSNWATVSGGTGNNALQVQATVSGGGGNTASGVGATVGGGVGNQATGSYATVPGGVNNVASGAYCFAAGTAAQAITQHAFVWSDGSSPTTSIVDKQFIVRASGGIVMYSSSGPANAWLAPGDSAWTTQSDRNAKKNFHPIDPIAVLDQLATVPIQRWNYKWEADSDVPNIGPMAQDFKHAFYPGREDKGISTLEFDGVELAAIQGLNQKLNEKETKLQKQAAEIQELKENVAELQKLVRAIAEKK